MNQILFAVAFLLFMFTGLAAFAQTNDSTFQSESIIREDTSAVSSNSVESDETDDFSPGMLFLTLLGLAFICVCVGAGILLTVLGLLILFGLISFGIVSASVLVGLNRKSFAKGFKAFLVLASTTGGILFFGAGFWLLNKISHWWTTQTAILTGVTFGLLIGLAFGYFAYFVLQKLTTYFKQKLNLTTNNS